MSSERAPMRRWLVDWIDAAIASDISSKALLLAFVLARRADNATGKVNLKRRGKSPRDLLVELTRTSAQTITRGFDELEAAGLVRREWRGRYFVAWLLDADNAGAVDSRHHGAKARATTAQGSRHDGAKARATTAQGSRHHGAHVCSAVCSEDCSCVSDAEPETAARDTLSRGARSDVPGTIGRKHIERKSIEGNGNHDEPSPDHVRSAIRASLPAARL